MRPQARGETLPLARREFVAGAAGLTFAFAFSGFSAARPGVAAAQAGAALQTIAGWVTISVDDTITIAAPIAEMGQGVMTALPMIVAEELDADWSKVQSVVPEQALPGLHGNPQLGGAVYAVSSRSIDGFWDKARAHGAVARRVLMLAAAEKWGVPLAEVSTVPSVVVHKASGRRMTYGEIASFAAMPAVLPGIELSDLKKHSEYRIIGKSVARLDIPSKVDGSAIYGIDVQVPGMVYATMLRSPVEGGAPERIDRAAALNVPGVAQVVALPDAVAVVGESVEAVFAGRAALQVRWKGGTAAGYDSEKALHEYATRARKLAEKGVSYKSAGDADGAIGRAAKVISAEYFTDYVHHAQMEPMNATVRLSGAGDGAEIWIGTQGQTIAAATAAAFLRTHPRNIQVHQQYLGGGFGRRAYADLVVYALAIAAEARKPVKLIWPREQDVKSCWARPQTAHFLQAGLDAKGNLAGWRHRVVAEAVAGYTQPGLLAEAKGIDGYTLEGAEHLYAVDNQSIDYVRESRGVALAACRAIGSGPNKFAIECFIDELAHARGLDPVELRLQLLAKHPRGQKVIETVATMAHWGRKPADGRALGFAYADVWRTPVAGVAEVSLDRRSGQIRVHRFWNAVNPGIVVNPEIVVQQSESNVVWGVSQALKERITYKHGEVQQSNYHDYQVLRMSEVPEIITEVISTGDRPTGIGEIVLPVVAPAIANAVFVLTGKRLRHVPFTPERVKAAIKA